jgi:hypothetical protein
MGRGRIIIQAGTKPNGKPETYHCTKRPMADVMLEDCRRAGKTKMLTSATRQYALAANGAMELGFDPQDIVAREDIGTETTIAYGDDFLLHKQQTDPQASLIDNMRPTSKWAKIKRTFLGIPAKNYIQIREFNGKDPEKFQSEWNQIRRKLHRRKKEVQPNPPTL